MVFSCCNKSTNDNILTKGVSIWQEFANAVPINKAHESWKIEKLSHRNIYRAISPNQNYYNVMEQIPIIEGDIVTLIPQSLRIQLNIIHVKNLNRSSSGSNSSIRLDRGLLKSYRYSARDVEPYMVNSNWTISFFIKQKSRIKEDNRLFYKIGDLTKGESPLLEINREGNNRIFLTLKIVEYEDVNVLNGEDKIICIKTYLNDPYKWNHIIWTQNCNFGYFYIDGNPDAIQLPYIMYNRNLIFNNGPLLFNTKHFKFNKIRIYGKYFNKPDAADLYQHELDLK